MIINTPDGSVINITPGQAKRAIDAVKSGSDGRPEAFATTLEWAADWVSKSGMTLPPKCNEYNTLRSWFCYQLQKWKTNTLPEPTLAKFATHGIDFSQYLALNTGKIIRVPDNAFVDKLRAWHRQEKTFDLSDSPDPSLQAWQAAILLRHSVSGISKRLETIEGSLPGFRVGLWRKPGDAQHSSAFLQWWSRAQDFREASRSSPCFRGNIHPEVEPSLVAWAEQQQADAKAKRLSSRQRGELYSLHLLHREDQREITKKRQYILRLARESDPIALAKGDIDRRLNSFLGAALLGRMLQKDASDIKLMTEFSISPADMLRVRAASSEFMSHIRSKTFIADMGACRTYFRADPTIFERLARSKGDAEMQIAGLRREVIESGFMIHKLQQKLSVLRIQQDII